MYEIILEERKKERKKESNVIVQDEPGSLP
jgi:hypothetical protein